MKVSSRPVVNHDNLADVRKSCSAVGESEGEAAARDVVLGNTSVDCQWESRTSQLMPVDVRFETAAVAASSCLVVTVVVEDAGRVENKIKLRWMYVF